MAIDHLDTVVFAGRVRRALVRDARSRGIAFKGSQPVAGGNG
jgi:hypothetical protein